MATTEVTPAGVKAIGKTKVGFFAGSVAAAGAVSLASDIGHAGFLNVSFYIPGTLNDWHPSVTQGALSDVRLGASITYQSPDIPSWDIPPLRIIEDPQGAGTGTPKGLLTEGTLGTLIVRYGLASTTDWALSQKVWAWYVLLGKRSIIESTSDNGANFAYQVPVYVQGTAIEEVAITT